VTKIVAAVFLVLGFAALTGGCSSDDDNDAICDQAYQKSKDCGLPVKADKPECNENAQCVAKCIAAAPCDQINSDADSNDYIVCAQKCQ